MMIDSSVLNNFVWGLLAVAGALVGAYVAIRSDLARLNEKTSHALEMASTAHRRIDKLGADHHHGG